jgi:hypothetical protein
MEIDPIHASVLRVRYSSKPKGQIGDDAKITRPILQM